ncbi:hypothetical protein QFC22_005298 [Naganishia vaughanmartiniae]|uniref:Uncharacterized protein n=1 Tax=Naganishia vaughanmartiniae TaxID=1424756 RepID=A0ACC2WWK9_9TREE|nr:hypothetical protein QFC22_005298 [Naganishia vaughanmartiniae]
MSLYRLSILNGMLFFFSFLNVLHLANITRHIIMISSSPLSQQHPDTLRANDMETTTPGPDNEDQKEESMQVVVEALPDIESGDAHPLGATTADGIKGKQREVDEESDDADDRTSENESDGDSKRDVKRVKLDKEAENSATLEQIEAGSSKAADGTGTDEKVAEEEDETFELRMTWAGQGFDLRVQGSDRLYDFKVCSTSVPY